MIDPKMLETAVAAFPVLSETSPEQRQLFLRSSKVVRVAAGDKLFKQGEVCRLFPLVLGGCIRVYREDAHGRQITLYDVTPGELCVLSSAALLAGSAYSASACARADTVLIALASSLFQRLIETSGSWRQLVFGLYAERLCDLTMLVDEIAFRSLSGRLAGFLAGTPQEVLSATHQQMADELGSVRVILTRLLGRFEERGWIGLERGLVTILNRQALREFAAQQQVL